MKTESDLLQYDFQGWPVYRQTIREILEDLVEQGVIEKSYTTGMNRYIVRADNPILDTYPEVLEDAGMGYSPRAKYICGSELYNNQIHLWVDLKDPNLKIEGE